jgi:hypothetical protein
VIIDVFPAGRLRSNRHATSTPDPAARRYAKTSGAVLTAGRRRIFRELAGARKGWRVCNTQQELCSTDGVAV